MPAMSHIWSSVVTSYSPHAVDFWGTHLVQVIAFWIPSFFYLWLDRLFPAFSERHKIQPAPKQPTKKEIRDCVLLVLRNQLISTSIQVVLTAISISTDAPLPFRIAAPLPSAAEFIRDFVICCLLREALFYYAHRALHAKALYRVIHKTHHKFIAPVALAAQYAHPVEHLLANTLPIALPPMLLHSHILTMWAFLAAMLLETSTVHSGYDFFAGLARKHDAHHEKFNLNYGSIGLMDWIHGTGSKSDEKAT